MRDNCVAAAQATYRAAQGQPLPKEQLRAGLEQHRASLVAERTGRTLLPQIGWPPGWQQYVHQSPITPSLHLLHRIHEQGAYGGD